MSEDLFSVLAAIGIIALVYRWFTTSPTPTSNGPNSAGTLSALQRRAMSLPRTQVDRLLTMFPQLTENEVRYALVVNRGGVEAVAERVLIRGGLEPPPPNFFPQSNNPPSTPQSTTNNPNNNNNSSTTTSSSSQTTNLSKTNPSLIVKLNLQAYKLDQDQLFRDNKDWSYEDSKSRLAQSKLHPSPVDDDNSPGSSNLKDRKARMVLESRWKMLQKEKKGKSVASN
ncbi:hypothetical protein PGTUg99_016340 [Puccinia graminis f. sp. tritici]|uniref:CUE domain-containing protein n=1 Tax=Puccinia graminis f. sp. tritici TaxID=56615 RepID=A0A5B0S3Z8_PUCGR|nr:hypothetical protein PGTUg99_016340 [Puccinia graminis f. sp. tritici]